MARFLAWFWAGLVAGVSFLATPVKFRADSLTMAVALDVGHVTLHALNRIEWLLGALLLWAVVREARARRIPPVGAALFGVVITVVILQSAWLLPALDLRTAEIMAGRPLPPSPLHSLFIGAETLKLLALLGLGAAAAGARSGDPKPRPE